MQSLTTADPTILLASFQITNLEKQGQPVMDCIIYQSCFLMLIPVMSEREAGEEAFCGHQLAPLPRIVPALSSVRG